MNIHSEVNDDSKECFKPELRKVIKNHFIRTANAPKAGERFMLTHNIIAEVTKTNMIHSSHCFGIQCYFKIITTV